MYDKMWTVQMLCCVPWSVPCVGMWDGCGLPSGTERFCLMSVIHILLYSTYKNHRFPSKTEHTSSAPALDVYVLCGSLCKCSVYILETKSTNKLLINIIKLEKLCGCIFSCESHVPYVCYTGEGVGCCIVHSPVIAKYKKNVCLATWLSLVKIDLFW